MSFENDANLAFNDYAELYLNEAIYLYFSLDLINKLFIYFYLTNTSACNIHLLPEI